MIHSLESLREVDPKEQLLLCIKGKIVDVTEFAKVHPGGRKPMLALAGRDATEAFHNYHPNYVFKTLKKHVIGTVSDWKMNNDEFAKDMHKLRLKLVRKGMFKPTVGFYVTQAIWLLALFVSSIYLTVFTPFFRIGALLLGLYLQQISLIGHDFGHNSVTTYRSFDFFIGIILGNTTGGISLSWWKDSHNVHHSSPNSLEFDSDNQLGPVFATSEGHLQSYFSEFHNQDMLFCKASHFLITKQHMTFYPILLVARFNLYFQSILYLVKNKSEHRFLEIITLLTFWGWILGLSTCLPFWSYVQWMVISHFSSSILEVQICLSHFAETSYSGRPHNDVSDGWFRNQLRTTLDISCPRWMDFAHGGLQFQISHHCFPRLPRANLRKATDMLKLVCKKHNVPYHSLLFYDANKKLISHMKGIAEKAKKAKIS